MPAAFAVVVFAVVATTLELALVIAGIPLFLVLAIGLALFATGILLVSWTPVAFFASVATYAAAVLVGLGALSWIAFGLSAL
jgi:hypothetical protein